MTLARARQLDEDDPRRAALAESFNRFVAESYDPLITFLQRQCFDRHLAEDALQEAMIVAMGKWERISTFDKPLYWVRKVAWNKLQGLQANQRWAQRVPLEDRRDDLIEPVSAKEAEDVANRLLLMLPAGQRAVFGLMLEGVEDDDMADQLGLAVRTVRTYRSQIRRKYRELFQDGGGKA